MPTVVVDVPGGYRVTFDGTTAECADWVILVINKLTEEGTTAVRYEESRKPKKELAMGVGQVSVESRPRVLTAKMLKVIRQRFDALDPKTDIARATIAAVVLVESGWTGLSEPLFVEILRGLKLRIPPVPRHALSNAGAKGYLQRVDRGVWAPTAEGRTLAAEAAAVA